MSLPGFHSPGPPHANVPPHSAPRAPRRRHRSSRTLANRFGDEFYRRLLDQSRSALVLVDAQSRRIYASPSIEQMLGYPPAEFMERAFSDFVHEDDLPEVRRVGARARKSPNTPLPFICRLRHKNGDWRWIEATYTNLLSDPNVRALVSSLRDVTELRIAEMGLVDRNRQLQEINRKVVEAQTRYRTLFEGVGDAVLVLNEQGAIIDANPAAEELFGYTHEELLRFCVRELSAVPTSPERWNTLIGPDFNYGDFRVESRFRCKDGSIVTVDGLTKPIQLPAARLYISAFRDISERKRAEAERARQLAETQANAERVTRLYDLMSALSEALTPDRAAQLVIENGVAMLGAQAGFISLLNDSQTALEVVSFIGYEQEILDSWRIIPLDAPTPIGRVYRGREPLFVESLEAARRIQPDSSLYSRVQQRAWITLPLLQNDRCLGVLGVGFNEEKTFSSDDRTFARTLAHDCAQALERARLYQAEQRARMQAEATGMALRTLAEASQAFAATGMDVSKLYQTIAEQATAVLGDGCMVNILSEDGTILAPLGSAQQNREMLNVILAGRRRQPLRRDEGVSGLVLQTGKIVRAPLAPPILQTIRERPEYTLIRERYGMLSTLAIPLVVSGTIIGTIVMNRVHPHPPYTEDEEAFLVALAGRAGQAIENARLYQQIQQAAAMEERQRLARDLHDAVTQTLFSANLIAEVLPRIWQKDPEEGQRRLEELRRLTRSASDEMRSLLMELRPATLTEAPLADLLTHLVAVKTGQSGIPIGLTINGAAALAPDVQVALYRIVQESLTNTIKHARAKRIDVTADLASNRVNLTVTDDGLGFVPGAAGPGRHGLRILHERAGSIGAALSITSAPGEGARIHVQWPAGEASR